MIFRAYSSFVDFLDTSQTAPNAPTPKTRLNSKSFSVKFIPLYEFEVISLKLNYFASVSE